MSVVRRTFVICNQRGLHARAAAELVKVAGAYQSKVTVSRGGTNANGKSIMSLLILAAPKGSEIQVEVDGTDADLALVALDSLITSGFGE